MKHFCPLIYKFLSYKVDYINRFRIDKYFVGELLLEGHTSTLETLNEYNKYTNSLLYTRSKSNKLSWFDRYQSTAKRFREARATFNVTAIIRQAENKRLEILVMIRLAAVQSSLLEDIIKYNKAKKLHLNKSK